MSTKKSTKKKTTEKKPEPKKVIAITGIMKTKKGFRIVKNGVVKESYEGVQAFNVCCKRYKYV